MKIFKKLLNKTPQDYSEETKLNEKPSSGNLLEESKYQQPKKTVSIGKQEWMVENLDVNNYRNGDTIPQVQNVEEIGRLTTGAWCYYENNNKYGKTYGKLYNWYAVKDSRGLAPKGWRVPTDDEWQMLSEYLGNKSEAGNKLKESGTKHWLSPNEGANNITGFTALPGGNLEDNGTFFSIGEMGFWWSSEEATSLSAWYCALHYNQGEITRDYTTKSIFMSVRCVKD